MIGAVRGSARVARTPGLRYKVAVPGAEVQDASS
jgi:hypothetical protein